MLVARLKVDLSKEQWLVEFRHLKESSPESLLRVNLANGQHTGNLLLGDLLIIAGGIRRETPARILHEFFHAPCIAFIWGYSVESSS